MTASSSIGELVEASSFHMDCLDAVSSLELADCWISAGFLRNLVWDHLHGYAEPTPLNDVDVLYFDPRGPAGRREHESEKRLRAAVPDQRWQVRNQARMHRRNGDAPYASAADAMRHWAETPTAVGVRLTPVGLEFTAPLGWDDLFGLVVRPTPHFVASGKLNVYRRRMAEKDWPSIWPQLTILRRDGPIGRT